MKKISFLIAFYKQENYVDNCIECIKKVKMPPGYEMEIVAGDDGSPDKTGEKLANWKSQLGEDKFKIVTANRNDGENNTEVRVGKMRKRLLKESSGDYVLFLDGDDYYCDEDFVVEAFDVFQKNPNVTVVMFKHQIMDGDKVIQINSINIPEGLADKHYYVAKCYVHGGSCVFKRIRDEKFEQVVQKAFLYSDNTIILINMSFGDLWFINKSVLNYRKLTTSIWNSLKKMEQLVSTIISLENVSFLAKEFETDIFSHFGKPILSMYFIRKSIESQVGKEFLDKYRKCILGKLGKTILDYYNATDEDKKEAEKKIQEIRKFFPEYYEKLKSESTE